jgi:hypothetical protein
MARGAALAVGGFHAVAGGRGRGEEVAGLDGGFSGVGQGIDATAQGSSMAALTLASPVVWF